MKNKILVSVLALAFATSFNSYAEDIFGKCKHNALHYATSIEDVEYVKDLLSSNQFSLKEYNKQCQTALNIAVELGNIDILEIFWKYLGDFNIENDSGENLVQFAIKSKQPEALLYLVKHGADPYLIASNGKNAIDYQNQYGNSLTESILVEFGERLKELDSLKEKIKLLENEISDRDMKKISQAKKDLEDKMSENFNPALEIDAKNQKQNISRDKLTTHIDDESGVEIGGVSDINFEESVNPDLIDINNNGTATEEDTMKMFEILSKPIFIKK